MATQLSFSWDLDVPEVRQRLLVTGASGFIGSFMVERALEKGFDVWAGIRSTSSRRYLQDERIHFIELDYANVDHLHNQLLDFKREQDGQGWDYIIHCAGATKCPNKEVFYQVNFVGTRNFVDELMRCQMVPRQFIFLSSLGAWGPQHERMPHQPITTDDEPQPNTAYGISKLCVEEYLKDAERFPWVVFRPTGVYGPRDKDYLLMVQGIQRGFDFALGFKHQDITFIYVRDLVKAVFLAIEKEVTERAYFVTDGDVHTSKDFSQLVKQALDKRFVIRLTAPLWLGRVACSIGSLYSRLTGKAVTLNNDKYRILSQRNWLCDTEPLVSELGFKADYDLARGTRETIAWYLAEGWLKTKNPPYEPKAPIVPKSLNALKSLKVPKVLKDLKEKASSIVNRKSFNRK
ncbi:MAG: NAD(P)-dependent oxidoreductase [Bacteroidaceae bacterium]|nr:NAD(P)-dependent oxidoreductase [Bacteroidaceae bacterium]